MPTAGNNVLKASGYMGLKPNGKTGLFDGAGAACDCCGNCATIRAGAVTDWSDDFNNGVIDLPLGNVGGTNWTESSGLLKHPGTGTGEIGFYAYIDLGIHTQFEYQFKSVAGRPIEARFRTVSTGLAYADATVVNLGGGVFEWGINGAASGTAWAANDVVKMVGTQNTGALFDLELFVNSTSVQTASSGSGSSTTLCDMTFRFVELASQAIELDDAHLLIT